ncbi:vacuolar protein sorting-associated protein 8-like protein [Iris pallida]|uniref:Vacuolar protein sorting-associated protein 8-like protein n=1 Tax=Iris pallida TaxID=29817 RepID=A0AAX6ETI5_IRIPA|nr:vacuolar protein sorting-associated protein 8-like protein [Iris pallida]
MKQKKLIGVPPMAELDLDSLLRSHGGDLSSSSDEDSSASFRRRTVDEILNESDTDSSSSEPKSLEEPPQINPSREDESTSETLVEPSEEEEPVATSWRRSRSRELLSSSSSTSSFSSLGFRNFAPTSSSSSSSRPLPPLFGSVRPNPKPGAALAAAAAASRSVPTPHAAAIKSRRYLQKIEQEVAPSDSIEEAKELESDLSEVIMQLNGDGGDGDRGAESPVVSEAVHGEEGKEEVSPRGADEENKTFEFAEDDLPALDLNSVAVDAAISTIVEENESESTANEVEEKPQIRELVTSDNTSEVETVVPATENGEFDEESGGIREEVELGTQIDRMVEERLIQLENTKKAEKKLQASIKPLERAEELEKKHASYGLHWEEGAAAQPMRLEGIRRGPPAVGYLQIDLDNPVTRSISSQTFRRDYGSPQTVAVHMNFIAMGTSKGFVLVFPSKYSAHSSDSMDAKMMTFGSHSEKSQAPATSMCFNQQGDLLLVGYGDGHLTVWDVQRATAKVTIAEHTSPVVHTLFLGQDSQVTRQFKAVTGDSKGLVLLHTFSVVPLLNRLSNKTQCLLDGQKTGTVLSACPLLLDDSHGIGYTSVQGNSTVSTSGLGSMMGGVVGGEVGWKLFNEGSSLVEEEGVVIFVTHQNALVVRLSPNVEVYEKFNKPDGVREGSMPYTAWKFTTHSHDSSPASWLVIAWDRRVQVAQLVKSEMKRYREWSLDSAAIGVAWLDDQMLVVLTLRGQLCLFSKDGNELHRTSFLVDGFGMDDIIMYHTHFTNSFGNPEKAYHNSIAVRGATIYILGPMHLIISRLLPWKERIQVLQRAGDWMGALDMAMRLYDGHAHGVIDLPRTVDAIREAIMPYLVELILSYVDEVFSYISVAFCNQIGKVGQEGPMITDSSVRPEREEQYARVGGVAVEFCVHIKRTDLLFDSIFSKFVAVEHGGAFLEILEPYILRDMLGSLPPEIMQALVEHYSGKGWLQRVEQCVLHMDISSLDFNQVVKLCREQGLYGALIYLYNRGLDDFRAPLEELLLVIQNKPKNDVADIGYRMLVYLKYCFQGLAFPPGHGSLSPSRLPSVRKDLLLFLLEDSKPVASRVFESFESSGVNCPNLCYLLCLDTEATLEILKYAFAEEVHNCSGKSLHDPGTSSTVLENKNNFGSVEDQNVVVQRTADVLILLLDLESDSIRSFKMDDNTEVWPLRKDLGHLLEFIAFLVTCKRATISGRVLKHILEYLTSCNLPLGPSTKIENFQREKQVIALLKALPQNEWNSSYVLHLCSEAHFYQACGLIHTIKGQYIAALDSYMKDLDEPVHTFAFINSMLVQLKSTEASSFQSAVISRIPELVLLSREFTYFLVVDHFNAESQNILLKLHSHPQSLFLFLKTAVDVHLSGILKFSLPKTSNDSHVPAGRICDIPDELEIYLERLSNFPKLLHHNTIEVTDEMAELYLELLCQYERKLVLKFLETFENYRLEHCLRLCQEYGVTDAAAFLLERVGDVGGALVLVMTGLHEKIDLLVAATENKCSEKHSSKFTEAEQFVSILNLTEVICVRDVLHASIGLCQRNTQRLNPQESESLWFRLLDSFSEPLRRFCCSKETVESQNHPYQLSSTSDTKVDSEKSLSRWRFPKLNNPTRILRRLFSQFVGEIIEGMAGFIPLPEIMAKLLSDNGNQEFGDFKLTILGMLGSYGYERRILDTAKSLIEDDTFYTMGLLKKGASHAFAPQNLTCCICGCALSKDSTTLGVRVFNCGHSTHLHCESEGSEQFNKFSSFGCPICLPKKNSRTKSKSVLVDNGLVTNSASSSLRTQGISNVQHLREPDIEKPYGTQQMSRFEILSNLQKAQKSFQIETIPQLRLSPPAIYHEKVQKGTGPLVGETSSAAVKHEKPTNRWQLRELKPKGALKRFPLKSNLFGPEKNKSALT